MAIRHGMNAAPPSMPAKSPPRARRRVRGDATRPPGSSASQAGAGVVNEREQSENPKILAC